MQPANATALALASASILARLGPALAAESGAPEWVQLMPAGPAVTGRDGRAWTIPDPTALASRSHVPFAFDWEHAQDLRAPSGEPAPAAGWVEELEVRGGAIWARVDWTERAKTAIAAREYRFVSPAFTFSPASGEVAQIMGAALVNRPNFDMAALNREGAPSPLARSPLVSLNSEGNRPMLIGPPSLDALFTAFQFIYNQGFDGAVSRVADVASETSSSTSEEVYPYLGQFPLFREWIGDRVVNQLGVHGWAIKNRKFETTVSVPRTDIEDDRYGVYRPMFKQMGVTAKLHPDSLVFPLLNEGFVSPCYDGQTFFSASHPTQDANGVDAIASNMQDGAGPAWFLLDTNQAFRPVIWQKRVPYEFTTLTASNDTEVFTTDKYVYGVRARVNAGYGLWQLAFGSKAPLNADNFAAARQAMTSLRGDRGGILGVMPNVLVVPPALEANARTLLKATTVAEVVTVGGVQTAVPGTNIWYGSADLIVTPFLA